MKRKTKWKKKYYNKYKFRSTCKGIREYNEIVNYFLVKDKLNGKSYNKLADEYKMSRDVIVKRIKSCCNSIGRVTDL